MRIDNISVELRPRSSWEAAELGTALVRTHARAIWIPYLIVTLPVFAALLAVFGWLDIVSWAPIAYWWLKPVFDRIPLFVVSRAVFGQVPSVRETLAAQRTWGWKWMLHYLTWRRLGPYRSLYLPVDLLEGGANKHARRNVIGGSARGVAAWLTVVFANFEIAFYVGVVALIPMFAPVESWGEMAEFAGMEAITQSNWYYVAASIVSYVASTSLEPFYVGSGFGLYLNRRTQLEAWDVELAFRRLRTRLAGAMMVAFLAIGVSLSPAHAETPAPTAPSVQEQAQTPTLKEAIGDQYADPKAFEKSVESVEKDPLLHPVKRTTTWVPRGGPPKPRDIKMGPIAQFFADAIASLFAYGPWVVLGVLLLILAITFKAWWPWLRSAVPQRYVEPSPIDIAPIEEVEALPKDIAAAARKLWAEGRARRALALLYRASVESMVARTGVVLVPGATEAECLRASRKLGAAEDRETFARVVRTWQYAAYADRMPANDDFEALLSLATQRFGWVA